MTEDRVEELTRLAQALDQPLQANWVTSLACFADQWKQYLEYQVNLDTGELGLVTLGEEIRFLEEVETYLQEIGVPVDGLALFKSMRRFAGLATWGLKVFLSGKSEAQLYARKPLPVNEVLFWLQQRQGISPDAAGQVMAISERLGKTHIHFLGVDFSPGLPARYQIYFTQYLQADAPVSGRVRQIMEELKLPDAVVQHFDRYHPLLAQPDQTLWVSVGLADGNILPSLKLDYEGVRLGVAAMVLEDLNLQGPQLAYLDAVSQVLQLDTADYLGLRLSANRPPTVSVYLTRVRKF